MEPPSSSDWWGKLAAGVRWEAEAESRITESGCQCAFIIVLKMMPASYSITMHSMYFKTTGLFFSQVL